ncbi:cell division protein ZapA [Ochrobactrum sp. RH2CCR150]|nr:cell division protein ZapA [Ochrobactrum sp. RH2CCR150]
MACDEGQEEHLSGLADRFDQYVTHLKSSFGEIGDLRLTVMAGIMVMDEMAEMQKRINGLESEVETLRRARDEALSRADSNDAALTGMLSDVASRLEQVASRIAPRAGS